MTTKLALLALVGGLVLAPTTARAQIYDDDPMPLAPPVRGSYSQYDDVFDWRDVAYDERVEISRATFDQDGYQLYDRRGQIIFVPFENNNLYVMRFGQTSGRMFFVNDGGVPTLYIPANGYLENVAASGARWYPFPQQFTYTRPIYIGVAPSWNDYMVMGWYPGMTYWGGYWDYSPWRVGYRYAPMSSWSIRIGNFSYTRWDDYCGFWRGTPNRRVVFIDRPSRYSSGYYNRNRGGNWDRDRYPYSRNEPQKDRLVRPGYGNDRNDRNDRDSRFDKDRSGSGRYNNNDRGGSNDRFDNYRFENNNRSGSTDRFGGSGSSARDRESSRIGGSYGNNNDSRFSRSGGYDRGSSSNGSSRPGGYDRGGSSSDRGSRPGTISRPSGSTRAPESRGSSSGRSGGGSSRSREARRQ